MTKRSSFKAPQKSLQSSWKGIESFKQNQVRTRGVTVLSYSKNGRKNITVKHEGSYLSSGSTTAGYQY